MSINYQKNVDLQTYNTLSIPAIAKAFVTVESVQSLKQVLLESRGQYKQLLLIGSGSNMVLPEFIDGLVIHIAIKGRQVEQETEEAITVAFAAGENWHEAVMWSVDNGWFGLENLALIPGTVGAAPVQNIGAYGVELKDHLVYLEAIHIETGERKRFTHAQCEFAYRESVFKQALKNQWVITRVVLKLSKVFKACLNYPALKSALNGIDESQLSSRQIAEAVIGIRQSKLPDPQLLPNAGSFFKNPVIANAHFEQLIKDYPGVVYYPVDDDKTKIAAGWLLEQDGWKGRLIAGVGMHKDQALVLINPNHLPAKNILDFASLVQQSIEKKFTISLAIEPMIIHSLPAKAVNKPGEDCA